MANPPIIIGTFDNVPAPGSPIRSDWPQEISQFVTDLDAGTTARRPSAQVVANPNTNLPLTANTWANAQIGLINVPRNCQILLTIHATMVNGPTAGQLQMAAGWNNAIVGPSSVAAFVAASAEIQMSNQATLNSAAGSFWANVYGFSSNGGAMKSFIASAVFLPT